MFLDKAQAFLIQQKLEQLSIQTSVLTTDEEKAEQNIQEKTNDKLENDDLPQEIEIEQKNATNSKDKAKEILVSTVDAFQGGERGKLVLLIWIFFC